MNYPVWDVPFIGSTWVVGGIAIFHVMISHFAVGGGLYLAMAEWRALKTGRRDWFEFLPSHSKFFLIMTVVFGAVSGVGIWFSIGLASPEATSTLIHNFVFGWAIEWTFFLIEVTAATVYYYTWNRIPERQHLNIGWAYAAASVCTLVIINGILTFMLTPGNAWLEVAGTGAESSRFFHAFFNPTFWPSLAMRALVCLALAGVWTLVTGSLIDGEKQRSLKIDVIRWSTYWLMPAFFLMPLCLAWYLWLVPGSQRALLSLGISTIGAGTFTLTTRAVVVAVMTSATILAVVYLLAYRKPEEFTIGYACAIVFLALGATGSSEHAREMLRKPYLVGQHMYSNGVRKTPVKRDDQLMSDVERSNRFGYLADTIWVREQERSAWTVADAQSEPATEDATPADAGTLAEPVPEVLARGELMFRGQCMACHTVDGYRGVRHLMHGRNRESIRNILSMLRMDGSSASPYASFMPPLVGTEPEVESLAWYLNSLLTDDKKPNGTQTVTIPEPAKAETPSSIESPNDGHLSKS